MFCPNCKKLRAAMAACVVCGSLLLGHGQDDTPDEPHSTAPIATAVMASGSGESASAVPTGGWQGAAETVMQHWWHQREKHYRVAIDAASQMMNRNLNLLS